MIQFREGDSFINKLHDAVVVLPAKVRAFGQEQAGEETDICGACAP
jgi:hypothetical protein